MPFEKGNRANPGGRPKEKAFTDAIRIACLEEDPKTQKRKLRLIAEKVVNEAIGGQPWACAMVGDRLEGKPAQAIVGDNDADPINVLSRIERLIIDPKASDDPSDQDG